MSRSQGREGAPVLMLSNSLGTDLHMWDDQAAEFEPSTSGSSATTAAATASPA